LTIVVECDNAENRLMKQGDKLILKIERYKLQEGYLPNSIEDIGVKETMEGPLF
jgi:hypothetical protein